MSLDKVLDVYKSWIKLYIEYSLNQGKTEQEIQEKLELYRPPTSDDDFMFLVYAHDSIQGCYDEDWNMK